ncbi:MAG: acetolactate synthase small subunit [Eubacteriales bacterium]
MKRTFSLLTENKASDLPQIINLFARRGVKILSLSLGATETAEKSCLTLQVDCGTQLAEQLEAQLKNLVFVEKVTLLDGDSVISRELMLVKVSASATTRQEILTIVELAAATVVDISSERIILELSGKSAFLDNILSMLTPFGILEIARTGTVAIY